MALQRVFCILRTAGDSRKINGGIKLHFRTRMTTPSGAILPEPKIAHHGWLSVFGSALGGLFIGVTGSKMIANFLEENELFVPSDDDDDD